MKYISYYGSFEEHNGEYTREMIDELIEYDFLKLMNNLKDWPPSGINGILATLLRDFPENKSHWIVKTLLLLEKYRDRWPESHYKAWHTYLEALISEYNLPGPRTLQGNAAEIVRQRAEYIEKQGLKRTYKNIMDDLSYWYNVPTANLLREFTRFRRSKK